MNYKPYIELSKPRITNMVLVTTVAGLFLGIRFADITPTFSLIAFTLIGTALSCSGSSILNNYFERHYDKLMIRTQKRPLVTGTADPNTALLVGILCILFGTSLLAWQVNHLCGFLALLTAFLYIVVYTPLKRITWMNTLIGAVPGALPPMGGWVAATGSVDPGSWALFLLLFVWQIPHFYAIAWMYKEDYERGGYKMLPVIDKTGQRTVKQVLWYSLLLIPVSFLPTVFGVAGVFYMVGVFVLGLMMLHAGVKLAQQKTKEAARYVLRTSIIYLPIVLALIVIDSRVSGI